jgi:hypothetical protein
MAFIVCHNRHPVGAATGFPRFLDHGTLETCRHKGAGKGEYVTTSQGNSSQELIMFVQHFAACAKARPWASRFHSLEEGWDNCWNPEWLMWALKRAGYRPLDDYREWACWCVRQVWHLIPDEDCRAALETAERFLAGEASRDDLQQAHARATPAAQASWSSATLAWAARAAAETASSKPSAAPRGAAEAIAWSSDSRSVWAETRTAQAAKLREIIGPQVVAGLIARVRREILMPLGSDADR